MRHRQVIASVNKNLSKNGYHIIRNFDCTKLLTFSNELGTLTVDPRNPFPIRALSPQDKERANPNTLSSRYGLNSFPYHTDVAHWRTPAHIVCLYCVTPGQGQRPTLLIDSWQWKLSKSDRYTLSSSVWRSRYLRPFLCIPIELKDAFFRIRYDPGCMFPFSPHAQDDQSI